MGERGSLSLAVLYDDARARETAVMFCDQLCERFWATHTFELSWWSFADLEDANSSRIALAKGSGADWLLISAQTEKEFSAAVLTWLDLWVAQRGDREGALVGLIQPGETAPIEKHAVLRRLAHRAGMDYLTQVPQSLGQPEQDSADACTERAHQVTAVLNGILHKPTRPPRL
jgi:hypothetical protein